MPERICRSWRTVILFPLLIVNDGRSDETVASRLISPWSTISNTAVAVKVFVIEPTRNWSEACIARVLAASAQPVAPVQTVPSA